MRPVLANDSFAAIGAGGIVLQKTDGVVMESEALYLSLQQVRVRYVFLNSGPKDLTTLVAFPVPDIEIYGPDDVNTRFLTEADPMQFRVAVDGQAVKAQLERKPTQSGVALKYYWTQTFPQGKRLVVEHWYAPATGGFFYGEATATDARKDFCIERTLETTLQRLATQHNGTLPTSELVYILSTGSHWKGPIRDFRLVIDKQKPDRMISLCIDGIRKISPTQFEVRKANFTPKADLRIAFFGDTNGE